MRVWSIIVVAGCWTTPSPAPSIARPPEVQQTGSFRRKPPPPSHCETSIDHVVTIMQPEIDRNPTLRDRQQELRDTAVAGCRKTGWPEEVLLCYDEAVDVTSLPPCFAKLTDDQRTDFNQRITDVMRQAVP